MGGAELEPRPAAELKWKSYVVSCQSLQQVPEHQEPVVGGVPTPLFSNRDTFDNSHTCGLRWGGAPGPGASPPPRGV